MRWGYLLSLLVGSAHGFVSIPWQRIGVQQQPWHLSSRPALVSSIEEASKVLQEWDRSTNPDLQLKSTDSNNISNVSSSISSTTTTRISRKELKDAVLILNRAAMDERYADSTRGQCLLGICAPSAQDGVAALKSWVATLQLPRGLLHGMDKDGVPLELNGGVYIKYNSGGVFTFADIRKSGMGFDSLWKPGDAMLEEYDGTYRGVYFQVQLKDGEFRQYLLPLDLLEDN
jgi:Domain of unknown function (DUF1824)